VLPGNSASSASHAGAFSRQMVDLLLEFRLARAASVEHQRDLTEHEQRIVDLENVIETMQRELAVYVPITPAQQEFIARSIKQIADPHSIEEGLAARPFYPLRVSC
jgi:hypothetical protein